MSKRLMFLISFILVLGLSGAAQAAYPIEVNNPSFELNNDGNRVAGHSGIGSVLAWYEPAEQVPFVGVDVFCPYANSDHCHHWPGSDYNETNGTGVVYAYLQHTGGMVYQVLDPNVDSNSVIVPGNQYKLTFDLLLEESEVPATLKASLFYVDDYNFPDANHNELASREIYIPEAASPTHDCNGESPYGTTTVGDPTKCPGWYYDNKVTFVAESGQAYQGKVLGIKLQALPPDGSRWSFVDNVRLEWDYATYAYAPSPADGERDVSKNPTLNWKSGTYTQTTNGHLVFFGTSYAEVYDANTNDSEYKDACDLDANSYTPAGTLELGKTYYWRIDEVNSAHTTPPPPVGPWKGDVWSFEVTGYATNPYPAHRELDVPYLNLLLEWTAGTDATSHDVYFGSDEDDVNDATSSDPNGPTEVFRSKAQSDPCYPVPESSTTGLITGQTYYWRIDERSAAKVLKGYVWRFTIGEYLIVDDFDSYAHQNALYAVWDDYWVNYSGAYIYLETDANYVRDGNSVRFVYDNADAKVGSYIDAQDPAELEVGANWTVGGVKALTVYFMGDPCNVIDGLGGKAPNFGYASRDRLWAELEDVGTNAGVVKHTDINDVRESIWHEWNIALSDFNDAGVDLSNLDRITIGIGGPKAGQSGKASTQDQIYIDDIRLYPTRCLPELVESEADFTGDCVVDACDLDVMATDWLMKDGDTLTEKRPATLTGFADATSHWTADCAVGIGAIILDANSRIDVTDPRLNGLAAMSMTAWVKQTITNEWVGIVCSRESVGCGDDATEIGIYGSQYGGPGVDALGYDWSCGTEEWNWDAGLDVPTDGTWTFVAIVVDPNGGQLYMCLDGGALQTGIKNTAAHATQQNFSQSFYIGRSKSGGGGPFVGKIDDVRIYPRALSYADVCDIALEIADPNPWPVYHYKFDETTGYTAADSGHPTYVYGPVPSVANLTDPEAKLSRFVNFKDFEIFADDWLKEFMYPPE